MSEDETERAEQESGAGEPRPEPVEEVETAGFDGPRRSGASTSSPEERPEPVEAEPVEAEVPQTRGPAVFDAPPPPGKVQAWLLHSPRRFAGDWKTILFLLVALSLAYLPGLGSYGLYDPWETHYGEVARNMVEHGNYIDPWWGSAWDPSGVKREREGFYSKPLLIMWMTSAGMNLFGFNELGIRFFFPLFAIMALLAIYLACSRFFNRRAGLIATTLTATAPIFAFMSRQAVPDGPMVAIMTCGVMALTLGLFHCKEEEESSPALYWLVLGLLVAVSFGQLWAILPMDRSPDVIRPYPGTRGFFFSIQWWFTELVSAARGKGWVISFVLLPICLFAAFKVAKQKRRRLLYVYLFYIACGLCVPAKGWLAWAPMGMAILSYCLVANDWRIWKQVDVPTGLLIVFVVGHPWIIAMLGGHHPGWYKRFWIHDHYNRLFSGVHSIDNGAFEYFFKWIGYGLFPWIGLLPAAMARMLGFRKDGEWTAPQRFQLFVFLWACFGFFLFTKSSTKFHHYIFPILPALALLMAFFVEDLLRGAVKYAALFVAAGAGIVVWVGQDLFRVPRAFGQGSQNLVNLFTYKYDREWHKFTEPEKLETLKGDALAVAQYDNAWLLEHANTLGLVTLVALIGYLFIALFKGWRRAYGTLVLGGAGVLMLVFSLHTYLPQVGVHWSQKGMWDAYYDTCTPFAGDQDAWDLHMLSTTSRAPSREELFPRGKCQEPIVAFRTNWRGETYYSANTVIPAPETKHLKPFLESYKGKPFYLFTERNRVKSELEPNLPKHLKGAYEQKYGRRAGANDEGLKFVLLRIDPKLGKKPSKKKKKGKKAKKAEPSEKIETPMEPVAP